MNFGKNIKKIRSIKKISQTKFAEIFDLTRSSVSAYEEERAEPKIEVILKIANYYNITVDKLINSDITVNEFYKFNIFDGDFNKSLEQENSLLKKMAFVEIPIVSSFDLHSGSFDKVAIKAERKIQLPNFNENHLAILISENSFEDCSSGIKNNDIVIVDRKLEIENGMKFKEKLWVLKMDKALYLGEIEQLKNGDLVYYSNKSESFIIDQEAIAFILPVESLLSNNHYVKAKKDDVYKKMEFKINDLYTRIS